jgi:hypothetical protein
MKVFLDFTVGNRTLFLVIPCPSGVTYSFQTGGNRCHHPEIEGALIPLEISDKDMPHAGCWGGPSIAEAADEIDAYLASSNEVDNGPVRVDRARLAESEEGWIWVVWSRRRWFLDDDPTQPEEVRCVMVYENCD